MFRKKSFNIEECFRSVVDNSNESISIMDREARYIYVNNAYAELFGYEKEDFEGRTADEFIHPEERDEAASQYEDLFKKRGKSIYIWRFRNKSGEYISFSCRASVFNGNDGKKYSVIVTNADHEVVRTDKKKKALYGIFFDLGSDPEENIRIIVRRSCEILEGACSLYNRIDYENDKIVTWAGHNLPPDYEFSDSPEGHICYEAVVKGAEDIVAIPDLDGTVYQKSDVNVTRYNLKSYLGSSISIEDRKAGSLCIVDTVVRNFSEEEKEIIHTLAKALSLEEMRKNAERRLRNSIKEQNYLMKEIHHRVKNNLLMITSLIRLKENTAGRDNFSDLIHQIDAIRIVHEKLYEAGDLRKIEIKSYFTELIETIFSSFSDKSVNLSLEIDDFFMNSRQIVTAGLLINEITTNALKHGFRDCEKPEYSLSVKKNDDFCEIVIRNSGSPIPEEVSLHYPETLGMRLISALTEQLGGTVEMIKAPSPEFRIGFKPDMK